MYIRRVKKQRSKDSKIFYQYTLAQTVRINGRVKQNAILYLGSDTLMADETVRKQVLEILKAKIFKQERLFPAEVEPKVVQLALSYFDKYYIKYGVDGVGGASIPPPPDKASFHHIDIEGLEVDHVHTFGAEHLCKQIIGKLQLEECLKALGFGSKYTSQALISIIARALFACSEHKTAQILAMNSSLKECFHYQESSLNHRELYAIADRLYKHQEQIDQFLYRRIRSMFDLQDRLVIFDISNTYFETSKRASKLAKYGRSKEKRSDCPLVVFTGVINAQGFIRHSRIYEGNKADTTTLDDMLTDLKVHSDPESKQTVVMDAGIASEENLALIKEKGYDYVCVSPHRFKDYPYDQGKQTIKVLTDKGKSENTLQCFTPQGYEDTWMYVQSPAKGTKEHSMNEKLQKRYVEELTEIQAALQKKGGTKRVEKVWERIGRAKERNRRVASHYKVEVNSEGNKAVSMEWHELKQTPQKKDKIGGVYFIRTSYKDTGEKDLWEVYNTIREVEATFRCLKTALNIRPVYHQKDQRVASHIYLTMLAYQLVNTIRHMLKAKNIHYDWKNIVRIMNTHTIQTIVLPTDKKNIHLRKPAKTIEQVQKIYQATGCTQTQKPIKKYVVYH